MSKQFYFKQFSFSVSMQLSCQTIQSQRTQVIFIWPVERTLSGATTPVQSEPGSDDNEKVLRILQHYWNLIIRLFSVILRTLIVGGLILPPEQRYNRYIQQSLVTGQEKCMI